MLEMLKQQKGIYSEHYFIETRYWYKTRYWYTGEPTWFPWPDSLWYKLIILQHQQNKTRWKLYLHEAQKLLQSLYNYNCHNIYWDPLIWLVKNGHLIALTCISFFNEPGPYSWGAGPFTTELLLRYCAMLLWRDSLQLLTLYLALTPIFSGRKAKINLHTTPKLTVVIAAMRGSRNFRHGGGGGGGGRGDGGSTSIWQKKTLRALYACFCFFAFFLVLGLFYRSQMVNFKVKYHFSRLRRGSKFFQGGSNFFQGGGGPIAYSL